MDTRGPVMRRLVLWPVVALAEARGILFPWVPVFLALGIGLWFGLAEEPGLLTYAGAGAVLLASGLAFLALFGSAMQDKKKRAANPDYGRHMAATSFVPFGMQLSGRLPLGTIFPGWVAAGGGLLVWWRETQISR